jgi:hypothetical protein
MVGIPSRHAARAVPTLAGPPCRTQMLTSHPQKGKPSPRQPGTRIDRERRAGM